MSLINIENILVESSLIFTEKNNTSSPAFKRWFGKSKVKDSRGRPLIVYHGTTAEFSSFDISKANPESNMGAGMYFTNNSKDVDNNYAGEGPDLTSKIDLTAERIAQDTDREYNDPDVVAEARAKFIQHQGATMPVYLSIQNPVIIGGAKETFFDFTEELDEEGEPTGNIEGSFLTFMNNAKDVIGDYSDKEWENVWGEVYENGGVKASKLESLMKEGEVWLDDIEGGSGEIFRQAVEAMGYDGIIDFSVNSKFGTNRKHGVKMQGVNEKTIHFIIFNPNQAKSIYNKGTWSTSSDNLNEKKE